VRYLVPSELSAPGPFKVIPHVTKRVTFCWQFPPGCPRSYLTNYQILFAERGAQGFRQGGWGDKSRQGDGGISPWTFFLVLKVLAETLEHGRVVRTIGPGSNDPRLLSWTLYLHICPPLEWCVKWCVDCLLFMHLKDPLVSFKKCRRISQVRSFQFWLNLESLSLNATKRMGECRISLQSL
jgi:hypothetical protein